jgi:hypothetical protein
VPTVHPSTAAGWFSLLQGDPLVGLLLFDVIHLVNDALLGLVFLALYATLHRANRSAMTIATICGLVGGGPDCPWAFPPCPPQAGQRKGRGC